MKIVTFEEFNRMPAGTIFAPWTPCTYAGEFEIKTDAGNEYVNKYDGKTRWSFNGTMPIVPHVDANQIFMGIYEGGPVLSEMWHYDGSTVDYEDHKLFAIMEEKDVRKVIEALEWALGGCTGEFDTDIKPYFWEE